jgi:hypothetical protein
MLVAPGLAGIAYGLHKAKKANAAHAETMRAGAPHLATLGIQAQKIMSGARGGVLNATARQRLGGTVKAATDLGLMRVRTPIGPAGIMLAEGLALRAGALLLPEGVSKELTGDIGTALTLAGGTMIASRGSSAKVLAALSSTGRITAGAVRGLASLNAARNVVRAAPPPAAVNTVAAARRTVAAVQRSTSTAGMVRAGVVRAVGASNLATARRLAVRGGALGAVAALGAVMGQTEAAQSAWAWVTGHYRTNSNGRTAYVAPYQRRVG